MTDYEKEILQKAMRFCAYRDRAESEIREKIRSWEVIEPTTSKIVEALKSEKFIDDQRFAISFARGKFKNNKWGKAKITHALYSKNIKPSFIANALAELPEDDYSKTIRKLIQSKLKNTKASNNFELRKKIASYLMNKGFEASLVWELLKDEIQD